MEMEIELSVSVLSESSMLSRDQTGDLLYLSPHITISLKMTIKAG